MIFLPKKLRFSLKAVSHYARIKPFLRERIIQYLEQERIDAKTAVIKVILTLKTAQCDLYNLLLPVPVTLPEFDAPRIETLQGVEEADLQW